MMIEGASAVKSLPAEMGTIVHTESQARELAKVEPAKRVEVLERVAESGKVTAAAIRQAANPEPVKPNGAPHSRAEFRKSLDLPPKQPDYRISPSTMRDELARFIRHRPAKAAQLQACADMLLAASKKFKAFAKKVKE